MAGELRTYDPAKVTAVWALPTGAFNLTPGLIDGAGAIAETKDSPRSSRRGDRNGNMVRNISKKKGGTLAFTYVEEAEIHNALSAYAQTDAQTNNIVGTITIKNLAGDTVAVYNGAHIEDDPLINYGDTAGDRVWVFGYAERIAFFGGSPAQ